MRVLTTLLFAAMALFSSCDLRSGIAKNNMEKYVMTPTPPVSPVPTRTPVDPADILTVDASIEGDTVNINAYEIKKTETCKKFNRVMINGDKNVITLKGGCSQIMVNGDANEITLDASTEIVLNGSENKVSYARFVNGAQPTITENRPGNTIEKISAEAVTSGASKSRIVK